MLKHQKPTPKLQTPGVLKYLTTLRTDSTQILNKHLFMLGISIIHLSYQLFLGILNGFS